MMSEPTAPTTVPPVAATVPVNNPPSEMQLIINAMAQLQSSMLDVTEQLLADRKNNDSRFESIGQRLMSEIPALPSPELTRRSSFLIPQEVGMPTVAGSVLVTQKEVPRSLIIIYISIRAYLVGLQNQTIWIHQNHQFQPLVNFFDYKEVLKPLVDNEKARGTVMSNMKYEDVYGLKDDQFTRMLMSYVRTVQAVGHTEFQKVILASVSKLRAVDPKWEFGVDDYDVQLHGRVQNMIDSMEQVWQFLNIGLEVKETKCWPDKNYGSEKKPGILRIFLAMTYKFFYNFERLLTTELLKDMKTVEELFRQLTIVNKRMATSAIELRQLNASSTPIKPLKETIAEMEAASAMRRRNYEARKDHNDNMVTPFKPSKSADQYQPRSYQKQSAETQRLRVMVEDDYDDMTEYSYFSEASPSRAADNYESARVAPAPTGILSYDWDNEEEDAVNVSGDSTLAKIISGQPWSGRPTPEPKKLYDPNVKTNPLRPCYDYFNGKCNGGCGFSHEDEDMRKYRRRTIERILASPFGGSDKLMRDVEDIKREQHQQQPNQSTDHRFNPRDKRLSLVVEPPAGNIARISSTANPTTPGAAQESS